MKNEIFENPKGSPTKLWWGTFGARIKSLAPYLILVLLIVLPWFLRGGYLFFTDMSWGPNMKVPGFTESGFFYFHFIAKILGFVLPISLVQKLFLSAIFALILFGGYEIAKNFSKNKGVLFLCAAFSLFNPFVYDRLMYGQIGILLGYGFFLAFSGFLVGWCLQRDSCLPPAPACRLPARQAGQASCRRGRAGMASVRRDRRGEPQNDRSQSRRELYLSAVFAGLAILFALHFVFFVGLVYVVVFASRFAHRMRGSSLSLRMTVAPVIVALIIVLINFNWLSGVFLGNSNLEHTLKQQITEHHLEVFKTRGKNTLGVLENVFLMSGFWGAEQFRYEPLQNLKKNWGRSFYLLLPIIVAGLVYGLGRRREIRGVKEGIGENKGAVEELRWLSGGLVLVYIISFVLAVGAAVPFFADVTAWLFHNVPFYKGLREPQKWVAVIVAVYTVFLALGLNWLFQNNKVKDYKWLIAISLSFIIIMQAPLLVWGGVGQVRPVEYPEDWYEVNEFIKLESYKVESKQCESKILFLPWHLYMHFNWIGKIVANPASKFFECPVIYGKNMEFGGIFGRSSSPEERKVEDWVFNTGRTNLMQENPLDIGYIILAKEVDWKNYLWLSNHPNVEFIKETKNLILYRPVRYEQKNKKQN